MERCNKVVFVCVCVCVLGYVGRERLFVRCVGFYFNFFFGERDRFRK